MTGLVRKATLLTFCGLAVAGSAMAGVPSATTSTLPTGNCIRLVGRNGAGVADPSGTFTIIVRDLANNIVANQSVKLYFAAQAGSPATFGCPDIRIAVQANQPAGIVVDPTAGIRSVEKITNALGEATFTIIGAARNGGGGGATGFPGSGMSCCMVKAGTVELGVLGIAAYDQDGAGGIISSDTSEMLGDTFNPGVPGVGTNYCYRSNVNCSTEASPTLSSDTSYEVGVTFGLFTTGASAYAW